MSDETAKVIEELIELEKKTTPGKWDNSYNRKAVTREDWKSYHPVLAHCSTFEDGDFIVALRNAFPVLADLARRAVEAEKSTATTAMGSEPLQHGMNCGALSVHSDSSACTCGLHWRKQLQTEQAMHAAWRKRAEEAEKTLLAAGNEISELSMIATNIETRAERAESRVRELEEANRLLANALNKYEYRDSLVNGDACQLLMRVPPQNDPDHEVSVAVRHFAHTEVSLLEAMDAVNANPIACAALERKNA